jgi:hypothetical protein
MDLAAFFASAQTSPPTAPTAPTVPTAPAVPIAACDVPVQTAKVKVKAKPTKSRSAKEPGVAARTTKVPKKSPAKPTVAKNSPSRDIDADDDAIDPDPPEADFDEIPEDDSQYGGGEDIHEIDSEIGDDACMEDDDLDDEAGMVTCDVDLDTSYSRIGAWKRRDKLPCPDFIGPPLEPDDDSHIL